MRRLREQFPEQLVVVGVHSPKFTAEQESAALREAVMRLGIDHPVVNDTGRTVWESYAVRAWPTVMLLSPDGRVLGRQAGEIRAAELAPLIERLAGEYDDDGRLRRAPLVTAPEAAAEPQRPLAFPSKLLAADGGRRLFVADTGHHQVVEIELDDGAEPGGRVVRRFGCGRPGLVDGAAAEAAFHHPRGLALAGGSLWVADTDNHAVRAIDLADGTVHTAAGTGEKGPLLTAGGADPTAIALRSPWDLAEVDGVLLVAMAGSHQIWALLPDGRLGPFAGNGREALVDGPRLEASFNQPSGLALGLGHLFVADPEASAVRAIAFSDEPRVLTLVGQGLFVWGDADGVGAAVRLQHPAGLAFADGALYVADSYNHKVKRLDPTSGRVDTLLGDGQAGHRDGPFATARLDEPEGLAAAGGRLFIADTNNHAVRIAELSRERVQTLRWAPGEG